MDDAATRKAARLLRVRVQYSVREFINTACSFLIKIVQKVKQKKKKVIRKQNLIMVDQRYFRPTEVETPLEIPQKQKKRWVGNKISFEELVHEMIEHD